jgi:hypothetical protein
MDDKQAAKIIIAMLDKYPFDAKEKAALESAIGILSWTYLAQNRTKNRREKLDKSAS